jgi:hypothetical protein
MAKRGRFKLTPAEWMLAGALVCVAIFLVNGLLRAGGGDESRYGGKPLSVWIQASRAPGPEGDRACAVVRRAIPGLLDWLQHAEREGAPPGYIDFFNRLLDKQKVVRFRFQPRPADTRFMMAVGFLSNLGPAQGAAVPGLIGLLGGKDEDLAFEAATILERLTPESIPPLIETLTNGNERAKILAAADLGKIGEDSQTVVPLLRQILKGGSVRLRFAAVEALSEFGEPCEELIPTSLEVIRQGDQDGALYGRAFRLLMQVCEPYRTVIQPCSGWPIRTITSPAAMRTTGWHILTWAGPAIISIMPKPARSATGTIR